MTFSYIVSLFLDCPPNYGAPSHVGETSVTLLHPPSPCVCVWVSVYACVCAWLCVHGCKHRAVQHADHRSVVPARPKLHRRLPLPGRGGQRSQWEAV